MGKNVPNTWLPYMKNKAYLKFNSDLLKQEDSLNYSANNFCLRNDTYNIWNIELEKSGNCRKYDFNQMNEYESKNHTNGTNKAYDKCFELLDTSNDYIYLKEYFLIEYENCMNALENSNKLKNSRIRNVLNSFCLDALAVRRLYIEQKTCCKQNKTYVDSTLCDIKLNEKYLDYNVLSLVEEIVNLISSSSSILKSSHHHKLSGFFCMFIFLFKIYN